MQQQQREEFAGYVEGDKVDRKRVNRCSPDTFRAETTRVAVGCVVGVQYDKNVCLQ